MHAISRTRPELPVDVNGKPVSALVDTGATDTVISKTFSDYLSLNIMPCHDLLNSANCPLNIIGQAKVKLRLTGLSPSLSKDIVVKICTDVDTKFILGMDYLSDFGISVSTDPPVIRLNDCEWNYNNSFSSAVFAVESVPTKDSSFGDKELDCMLDKFGKVFEKRVGTVPNYVFKLRFIKQPQPFRTRPFRIPFAQLPEIKAFIEELLENDIIQHDSTP